MNSDSSVDNRCAAAPARRRHRRAAGLAPTAVPAADQQDVDRGQNEERHAPAVSRDQEDRQWETDHRAERARHHPDRCRPGPLRRREPALDQRADQRILRPFEYPEQNPIGQHQAERACDAHAGHQNAPDHRPDGETAARTEHVANEAQRGAGNSVGEQERRHQQAQQGRIEPRPHRLLEVRVDEQHGDADPIEERRDHGDEQHQREEPAGARQARRPGPGPAEDNGPIKL